LDSTSPHLTPAWKSRRKKTSFHPSDVLFAFGFVFWEDSAPFSNGFTAASEGLPLGLKIFPGFLQVLH
jgi:hypothetical protein